MAGVGAPGGHQKERTGRGSGFSLAPSGLVMFGSRLYPTAWGFDLMEIIKGNLIIEGKRAEHREFTLYGFAGKSLYIFVLFVNNAY